MDSAVPFRLAGRMQHQPRPREELTRAKEVIDSNVHGVGTEGEFSRLRKLLCERYQFSRIVAKAKEVEGNDPLATMPDHSEMPSVEIFVDEIEILVGRDLISCYELTCFDRATSACACYATHLFVEAHGYTAGRRK